MKFTNGCWMTKEGHKIFSPAQVYSVKIDKQLTEVWLSMPTEKILNKGQTLGGVMIKARITAPAPDVIRVQAYHYMGVTERYPNFDLYSNVQKDLQITDQDERIEVTSGALVLHIAKDSGKMTYTREGEVIAESGSIASYVKTAWKGLAYDDGGVDDTYMQGQFSLGVGELVYGLGERFGPLVKNGQSINIWNEDGGTSTEQSYKNIPFYFTNRGYGVFVNHTEKVSFEVGTENVAKTFFSVPGEQLDYYVINGPTPKEVLERYTNLTGKPGLPPAWSFGLWLSTSFLTNYDEQTVTSFVDGMLERDIPMTTFHFDCLWMKEFHWSNFIWDERVFPDPKGMIHRLKAKKIKISCWINPYIAQESELFAEGMENNYFIKRPNGDIWQWDMWQPAMAIVDFTNPDACDWYCKQLGSLLAIGVDSFKTDFGERIPTDVTYFDGSDPQKMHNYYSFLYNKVVYEYLEEKKGKGEAVLFARAATAGGQMFPVHWGGDCWSDYPSMEQSLRGGLSLTMSGFGFWSHDIGGFEDKSTPDIYKRWVAFGLLSSHSRLHGSSSYRVPWLYDEESVDVLRFFTKLKHQLMPYLYTSAVETSKTGVSLMRSMAVEFPSDPNCSYLDKQYMLGSSLLVAPIFNEKGMGLCYLPEGTWTSFFTNIEYEGGKWVSEHHDYFSIPLFVKQGTILPWGSKDDSATYDYKKDCCFVVYSLAEGASAMAQITGIAGEVSQISCVKSGNQCALSINQMDCSIMLINYVAHTVVGASFQVAEGHTILQPTAKEITVSF